MVAMAHALTAFLVLVIALLTLMPQVSGPQGIPGFDKLAHVTAFAALAMPLSWRYPHRWRCVVLVTLAYGGLIEIMQPLTGRSAEWADMLADGTGAFAGAFAAARSKSWQSTPVSPDRDHGPQTGADNDHGQDAGLARGFVSFLRRRLWPDRE